MPMRRRGTNAPMYNSNASSIIELSFTVTKDNIVLNKKYFCSSNKNEMANTSTDLTRHANNVWCYENRLLRRFFFYF